MVMVLLVEELSNEVDELCKLLLLLLYADNTGCCGCRSSRRRRRCPAPHAARGVPGAKTTTVR